MPQANSPEAENAEGTAATLAVDDRFQEIVDRLAEEPAPRNPETHAIYAGLGSTALAEPRVPSHGRVIIPESSPHPRRQARQAELRALGGLSLGQRSHIR